MFYTRRRQLTRPFLARTHILKNLQERKDSNSHRADLESAIFTQLNYAPMCRALRTRTGTLLCIRQVC